MPDHIFCPNLARGTAHEVAIHIRCQGTVPGVAHHDPNPHAGRHADSADHLLVMQQPQRIQTQEFRGRQGGKFKAVLTTC
jgi:hypothetical protein